MVWLLLCNCMRKVLEAFYVFKVKAIYMVLPKDSLDKSDSALSLNSCPERKQRGLGRHHLYGPSDWNETIGYKESEMVESSLALHQSFHG